MAGNTILTQAHIYEGFSFSGSENCVHSNTFDLYKLAEIIESRIVTRVVVNLLYDCYVEGEDGYRSGPVDPHHSIYHNSEINFRYRLTSTKKNHDWEELKQSAIIFGKKKRASFIAIGDDIERVWLNFTLTNPRYILQFHNIEAKVTSRPRDEEATNYINHIKSQDDNMKYQIFLCYAKEDKDSVYQLQDKLIADGFTTWLDEKDILPGQDWELAIKKAIKSSEIVLIFLSKTSVQKRGYIQKEMKDVLELLKHFPEDEIFLIPILLDDCEIPAGLSKYQALKLYQKDSYNQLLKSLRSKKK